MGFKAWMARNTQTPSDYASAFAPALVNLVGYLSASLVAYSGTCETEQKQAPVLIRDHFGMELSGFHPVCVDPVELADPMITMMALQPHFAAAFRVSTAFVLLYSEHASSKSMKPENAEKF